ncbi:DmsE family decaheme c-type cytochrome [Thiocystis violascens]|uniref:Decaheme c-type cytochrome, DmsE family n=1 Tax=Thiocystis violascens (strain ATCC 17096 / DSM 198 / 6111) TaxID=765911 RepID=I3YED7_THIV6|nr:DmsE family decaheme c-type cytochrome [Thiocystis violascens]AFL75355.1 decaheme c-type cytochrome, DmsE family [Thiocystis violascens DSM 198]
MSIFPSLSPPRIRLATPVAMLLATMLIVSCTPMTHQGVNDGSPAGEQTRIDLTNQDSTYIGEKACIQCHEHANEHASMGEHLKAFRANPRTARQGEVCESCHGPGSKHAEDSLNPALIIGFTRDWGTPVAKQNTQCLTCHQGGERLHWVRSTHDINGLACSDCHSPMVKNSVSGALVRSSISETCYTCHQKERADFHKRSHMPLPEGKMTCVDCHNPHGSPTRPLLKGDTVNEVCYTCHAEKRGPFLWEHAPVRENCANCHVPHGSNNEKLLVTPRPFLCQQCHDASVGHPGTMYNNSQTAQSQLLGGIQSARVIGRGCQNCHTQIHGSNHPSGARFQR